MTVEISKKICLLGVAGSGKTSLVRRYIHNRFDEGYLPTPGVQVSHKQLEPLLKPNSITPIHLKMVFWDLDRVEKANNIIFNHFLGSHGAVVVFDLTRPQTFSGYGQFLDPFRRMNPHGVIILVANKFDLAEQKDPGLAAFDAWAREYSYPAFCASARTGENVEKAFDQLGHLLVEAE